jgi:hypothetical protein
MVLEYAGIIAAEALAIGAQQHGDGLLIPCKM